MSRRSAIARLTSLGRLRRPPALDSTTEAELVRIISAVKALAGLFPPGRKRRHWSGQIEVARKQGDLLRYAKTEGDTCRLNRRGRVWVFACSAAHAALKVVRRRFHEKADATQAVHLLETFEQLTRFFGNGVPSPTELMPHR